MMSTLTDYLRDTPLDMTYTVINRETNTQIYLREHNIMHNQVSLHFENGIQ